jgi:predicted MarR family transcription regulator
MENPSMSKVDKVAGPGAHGESWHLSRNSLEKSVTYFEYSVNRTAAALDRWNVECLALNTKLTPTSTDNFLLNVIRMKDKPKTISELARFLNRDDLANIQYALRKLQKAGLIEKHGRSKRRGITYKMTEEGIRVTDAFAEMRSHLLMKMMPSFEELQEQLETTEKMLAVMQGLYDQATGAVLLEYSSESD